jgi:hypothetical protein
MKRARFNSSVSIWVQVFMCSVTNGSIVPTCSCMCQADNMASSTHVYGHVCTNITSVTWFSYVYACTPDLYRRRLCIHMLPCVCTRFRTCLRFKRTHHHTRSCLHVAGRVQAHGHVSVKSKMRAVLPRARMHRCVRMCTHVCRHVSKRTILLSHTCTFICKHYCYMY